MLRVVLFLPDPRKMRAARFLPPWGGGAASRVPPAEPHGRFQISRRGRKMNMHYFAETCRIFPDLAFAFSFPVEEREMM